MLFVSHNHPNINLSKIEGVTSVFCGASTNELTIHLECDEGNEQLVFENLPHWVHLDFRVVKSYKHVFIEVKK